jgi:WD40 repeat protein
VTSRFRPVIRVFVSSTFSDLKQERNVLQRDVFPRLEHYCLVRGFQFQAIDLRWGVPGEAGRDHSTMQICFDELRRAQEVSPRPNFLVLLGDRYGWQPLAESITEDEFQELAKAADELDRDASRDVTADDSATRSLRLWYRRDDNAVPVEYLLRSRNEWPDAPEWSEEREREEWSQVEGALWAVVNRAYRMEGLTGRFAHIPGLKEPLPSIVKFQASATEQEIWRGALAIPDAPEHVVAWYRTIRNSDEYLRDERAKDFFDRDATLHRAASQLRDELMRRLHKRGRKDIQPVEVDLRPSADDSKLEVTHDHLQPMCGAIEVRLREIVDEEIRAYWRPIGSASASARGDRSGPSEVRKLELEAQAHERFGETRAPKDGFVGRDQELKAIADYLCDENDCNPLVVHGPSGTGKTALLARAAQAAKEGKRRVIVRFLGTTPQSSNLRGLLANLCRALRTARDAEKEVPAELYEVQEEFDRLLTMATAEKPILLFLDALDQLDEADGARQTYWLRTPLPPHLKVVVSCIREDQGPSELNEPYHALERRKLLGRAIAIDSLTALDAIRVINVWLQHDKRRPGHKRQLTMEQRDAIAARITPNAATASRRPLYLRILFEECCLWPSWKVVSVDELGDRTPDLLDGLFKRLESASVHGRILVASALGYLASARRGLSENEMLEVLWVDPDYREHLNEVSRRNNHELQSEATRIPIAIWSRLRHDLDPYLAEHTAPGGVVLSFYHREVSRLVAECYLKAPGSRYLCHNRLAVYFQSQLQPWWRESRDDRRPTDPMASRHVPNARKTDELPQQWLWAADASNEGKLKEENSSVHGAIEKLFQCLAFLEAKVAARMTFDLIADFDAAIKATPDDRPHHRTLRLLHRALRRDASAIVLRPHLLLQFLWHTCYWHDSPLTFRYCEWEEPNDAQGPSLPWNEPGPKLFELMERWLEESKHEGSRRPWLRSQRPSGVPLTSCLESVLRGHIGAVRSVAVTSNGRLVASGSDDMTVRLWNAENATEIAVLRGHTAAVSSVAITSDGLRIVSASEDKTVRIWDTETCTQVGILHGSWRSELSEGGGVFLNTLTLSQYSLPEMPGSTGPHKGFTSVAITPDGRRIVCGSEDDIRVWDPESGDHLTTHWRWVWYVNSVAVTQDGRTIVSDGRFDTTAWNPESGVELSSLRGNTQHCSGVLVWDTQKTRPVTILKIDANPDRPVALVPYAPPVPWRSGATIDRNAVTVTPDGRCIVSGSVDGTIRVWQHHGAEPALLKGPKKGITSIAVTPDGCRIVSGSADGTVRVWDSESGAELAVLNGHESGVTSVAVTPNGRSIFSSSMDRTVRLWGVGDMDSDAAHYKYLTVNAKRRVGNKKAVLPDGRSVEFRFQTGAVGVWDTGSRILQAVIPVDSRFDGASVTSNARELELSALDETVIYALDISTPKRRKKAFERVTQSVLRLVLGVQREDTPLIAPTAAQANSDWSERILQTALRWAFGVQADDTPFNSTIIPVAEFHWPGHTVQLTEFREYAKAISREVIPCTVEADGSVFHPTSGSERTA